MATAGKPTLLEAASSYLAGLSPERRQEAQAEIHKFARWCGADRAIDALSGHDVSTYAESVSAGTVDAARRLDQLRAFLSFARKQGLTSVNLATHVRLRKTAPPTGTAAPAAAPQEVQVTAEGHAGLHAEVERLRAERPRVADELRRAMADKDFRENAPLDAMRDHQAMLEGRIREIEAVLRHAVIARTPTGDHRAQIGSTVVVRNLDSGRELRYTLVSPSEVNPVEGKISFASPVGKALMERAPGDEVEVATPAGTLRLRVERVEA